MARYVVDVNDLLTGIMYAANAVSRTLKVHAKDYDYNRGIVRGLQMAEEMAREFHKVENEPRENQSKDQYNYTGVKL